ncbi:cupin domain-containing protein [Paenibacillus chibensis]|nr:MULTISPECIES: cupin domain-containing protein [Paenibacillus]MEC0373195.1 cupin domain-containing protein [Paenibacillus chibensis]
MKQERRMHLYRQSSYHHQWLNPMYYNWHFNNWSNQGSPCFIDYAYNCYERNHFYGNIALKDYGPNPFAINIEEAAKQNSNYRTALWTGEHLQVTLMSINVGEDIGLEIHPALDQFLRIEEGQGLFQMGRSKDRLDFQEKVFENFAIMVPAGTWHNLTNTGNKPIKLYSIYAPPQHPYGTVQQTKPIAIATEESHHY